MADNPILLDALERSIQRAGGYNKNDQCAPAAILWPDKERQWEPLLPALRERLPLLALGPYAPKERTGPAYWLRCMIARTLPEDVLPADIVPIIYLPGVSRADIRAIEECPKPLQPLAELQYRGVLWTHKNGRDWTVAGFLQSADGGLGIAVSGDAATREALGRALLKLAYEPIPGLKKEAPLKATFFNELLNPDQAKRLLLWLNEPRGYRKTLTQEEWYAFCELCKHKYGFHPIDDGELSGAKLLGDHQGAWQLVWDRFEDTPDGYPNLEKLLRQVRPERSIFESSSPYWPQDTETAEADLRAALLTLSADPANARSAIAQLEAEHGPRRTWVWTKLRQAPLANALQHLVALAQATEKALGGATVADIAAGYTQRGWQADAAALDALEAVEAAEDVAAVKTAIVALYRTWLANAAAALQVAILGNPAANYAPGLPPSADPGTCILFSDALRFDAGRRLVAALERRGLSSTMGWHLAALPTVTSTAKPAVSPAAGLMAGSRNPSLTPVVEATGTNSSVASLRKLLEGADYQILTGDALGDPGGMAWTELGAIDQYGHEHGWKLSHHLPAELRGLEGRIDALLSHGWQRVVVVTDHGWLLLPGGLPKVELPQHLTILRKGRCAVLKEGAETDQHTVPWHWNKNVRIAVATGIACYEAGKEYEHGGISPQECIVPVITVSKPVTAAAQQAEITNVIWKGLRCSVSMTGATVGTTVDIRTKAGNAATSLAAPKAVETDAASLLIADDDLVGAAAFVVLLSADGTLLAQTQTTVGG